MTRAPGLDRRSLLQGCGAGMLAAGFPVLSHSALAFAGPSAPTDLVLVDRRYGLANAFAARFDGPGAPEVLPVGRDLAKLWQIEIAPRLLRAPLGIEAVTLPADLFGFGCLAGGSGGSLVRTCELVDGGGPRRGSPKSLVYWRMRLGGRSSAGTG